VKARPSVRAFEALVQLPERQRRAIGVAEDLLAAQVLDALAVPQSRA
jgi:hypothetical protein